MISQGLVEICSKYMHHQMPEIRRESLIMLGSLLTVKKGLSHANSFLFEGLKKLLFDSNTKIRESCGFCICRIVSAREGVDILVNQGVVSAMIKVFLEITSKPH